MDDWTAVAASERLRDDDARLQVQVDGRWVALFRHRGTLYAIDATCYHMGGPVLPAGENAVSVSRLIIRA